MLFPSKIVYRILRGTICNNEFRFKKLTQTVISYSNIDWAVTCLKATNNAHIIIIRPLVVHSLARLVLAHACILPTVFCHSALAGEDLKL